MAPEEWPIVAPPSIRAAYPARHAGHNRLPVVRRDFFLDPDKRLSEQERALMTAMLADLLGCISDELRAAIPGGAGAANDEDGHQLLLQLGRAGLLDDPALISLLLKRADEERIATAMRSRTSGHPAFLQALVADTDPAVAAAAMALIIARGARRDRLGQPRVQFDDLSDETAVVLTHQVAAALRPRLMANADADEADRKLSSAAESVLARRSADRAIATLTTRLVETLEEQSKLDESALQAAAEEGDLCILAEALARRAGLSADDSWDHLVEGRSGRLMLLLRIAGASRQLAARMLAILGDMIGIDDAGDEIARFDSIGDNEAEHVRVTLRLDPSYHEARRALENGHG